MRSTTYILMIVWVALLGSCQQKPTIKSDDLIYPSVVTQKVKHDSDDPAIWINPTDTTHVLIVGTDKGGESGDGGLYAFDLTGKKIDSVRVDIAYGLLINGKSVDIAVCTERLENKIRVFSLPELDAIDNGGIPVFETEPDSLRDPMGIALYTNPIDHQIYAIVGRKSGPTDGSYLWQYLLTADQKGIVTGTLVRKFGFYSGRKEIESIAVDNELGYVYHSDEMYGIHKSYAHPDSSNREIALFGTVGFTEDIEGISIYKLTGTTGYLLVSDQQASQFRVFPREGSSSAHDHPELASIKMDIIESDGSDVTNRSLPGFPKGVFVAMTDDGTFRYYNWEQVEKKIPKKVKE